MTEQLLLALKAIFVVVLYLFVWRVVRLSVRDLRGPQESMVLGAADAERAGLGRAAPAPESVDPRLVVLSSPIYPPGTLVRLRRDVTFGRDPDCDVVLDGDSVRLRPARTRRGARERTLRRGSRLDERHARRRARAGRRAPPPGRRRGAGRRDRAQVRGVGAVRIADHASSSHTGKVRRTNEDSYLDDPPLFVVADGMGGARAGELASRLAVDTFRELAPAAGEDAEARLRRTILESNRRVLERAQNDPATAGMGSTVTAALLDGDRVVLGHVGDSRAYLLRDGVLQQLSHDHSLVAELERAGRLTREEAAVHPQRSVITRALGAGPSSRSTPASSRCATATSCCCARTASPV